MKRSSLLFLVFMLIASLFIGCAPQEKSPKSLMDELDRDAPANTLSEKEKTNGWKLLFDGESFENWHGFKMDTVPDCWQIEGNALKINVEGGAENAMGLASDKEYDSFAFSVEFKLTKAANSGILYHVVEGSKYKYAYETGAEYQVIDHEGWPDKLEDWQIGGANYAMHPPMVKPYKSVGEWNQALLVVEGNKVRHYLNGELLVEFEKYSDDWTKLRNSGKWNDFPDYGIADKGHIVLQNHGTQVFYRNVKVKEL